MITEIVTSKGRSASFMGSQILKLQDAVPIELLLKVIQSI